MNTEKASALKSFREALNIQAGELFHLRFGPLELYIEKNEQELQIKWSSSNDWLDSAFHYEYPFKGHLPENLLQHKRFAYSSPLEKIKVTPCLGEKPFVARPQTPLMILPGHNAKIFLSTPMSLRIAGDRVFDEIPVMERSQTWFGESVTRGELCFFTNIYAALREEDLPFRPHRAMTHVNIQNRSQNPIPVDRLKIPVPAFSLFQRDSGRFVTSSLDVRCDSKGVVRDLKIRPPSGLSSLVPIAEPRQKVSTIKTIQELMR